MAQIALTSRRSVVGLSSLWNYLGILSSPSTLSSWTGCSSACLVAAFFLEPEEIAWKTQ